MTMQLPTGLKTLFKVAAENPAVKLANEWRDTLFYSGILLGLVLENTGSNFIANSPQLLFSALVREGLRSDAWDRTKQTRLAGYNQKKVRDSQLFRVT
jgi:hypothetical protein